MDGASASLEDVAYAAELLRGLSLDLGNEQVVIRRDQADTVAQAGRLGASPGVSTKSEEDPVCAAHRGNGVGGLGGGSGHTNTFSTCAGLMRTREPSAASVSDIRAVLRSTCACTTLMSSLTVMSPDARVRIVAIMVED
jgi:hypothetical protein